MTAAKPSKQEVQPTNGLYQGLDKVHCQLSSVVQHTEERESCFQMAKPSHPQPMRMRHIIVSSGCERSPFSSWPEETRFILVNIRF